MGEEGLRSRDDRDLFAGLVFALELDDTVDQCVKRVVLAHADVLARVDFRTTLANDDVSGADELAAEFFHTESATR